MRRKSDSELLMEAYQEVYNENWKKKLAAGALGLGLIGGGMALKNNDQDFSQDTRPAKVQVVNVSSNYEDGSTTIKVFVPHSKNAITKKHNEAKASHVADQAAKDELPGSTGADIVSKETVEGGTVYIYKGYNTKRFTVDGDNSSKPIQGKTTVSPDFNESIEAAYQEVYNENWKKKLAAGALGLGLIGGGMALKNNDQDFSKDTSPAKVQVVSTKKSFDTITVKVFIPDSDIKQDKGAAYQDAALEAKGEIAQTANESELGGIQAPKVTKVDGGVEAEYTYTLSSPSKTNFKTGERKVSNSDY